MSKETDEEYMNRKNLRALFETLVVSITVDKPANVAEHVLAKLQAMKASGGGVKPKPVPDAIALDGYSLWTAVPMAPADPILGLATAFKNDPHEDKVTCLLVVCVWSTVGV